MRRPITRLVGMGEPVLAARNLYKRFKNVEAVRGVDVVVLRGERVGLLGPNGAGKTTTLLMLLGAVRPDAGTIHIDGFTLPRQRSKAMTRVGFAAGYLPMPDRLKVREALTVFAGWYGLRRPQRAVDAALERFHITDLAERLSSRLSSGQRTLVGIVKATLHEPSLLVLDEPTASLDPDMALKVRTALLEYCETTDAALLVTSHDMREVEMLTERVMFLARGEVVANDTPAIVAATYGYDNLEDVFLSLAETHGR
jgi:ABC-2 type transport system ATP-binding protein